MSNEALAGNLPNLRETLANAVARRDQLQERLDSLNANVAQVEARITEAEEALAAIKGGTSASKLKPPRKRKESKE